MWLFTPLGFFSVVQKKGDALLTIRARVAADLDALRERLVPELGPTRLGEGTDYPARASVEREALARAMAQAVLELDYANFKSEVARVQGSERAHVYGDVWTALLPLEQATPPARKARSGKKPAFGGFVVDEQGRVLLMKPRNGFGGYAWTFPKGRPDEGETPEQTAVREVQEETGLTAEILARIPGSFRGTTTETTYFVMRPTDGALTTNDEVEALEWVPLDKAEAHLNETPSLEGRARDLAILRAGRLLIEASALTQRARRGS